MAFETVTTNLTSVYTLDIGDELFVFESASIVTGSNAIVGNHDGGMSIVINGTVAAMSTAISLGDDATSTTSLSVTIGETGSVTNLLNATAIFIARSNALIVNHGQVSADYMGVLFANGAISGAIENTGTVYATSDNAVKVSGDYSSVSGTFTMFNSGLLRGGNASVHVFYQSLDMQNLGTIFGDIGVRMTSNLGVNNTMYLNNSGVIIGRDGTAVDATGAGDTFINSGKVTGDVNLKGGSDHFDGRGGTVDGTVYGGLGDDVYVIDDSTISLFENIDGGIDEVQSTVGYTLADDFEYLTLIGADHVNGFGNNGSNVLFGNAGDNVLHGKDGDDSVFGSDGADRVVGGLGDDSVFGDDGNDVVLGRNGKDKLYGGNGADVLKGGRGNDTLRGNNGDDRLVGGLGKDVMNGGDGSDTFVFSRQNDSPNNSTYDVVRDFVIGDDLIDLSGISGTLTYIGGSSFTGTNQELRHSVVGGSDSMIRIDLDGDGTADMKILIEGTTSLNLADFIL